MVKDPEKFFREAVDLYREWKKSVQAVDPEIDSNEDEEIEPAFTFEQAEELAWTSISQFLSNINPYEFQSMVAALIRAMGYFVIWEAPPGKDGGTDILAFSDPLGATRPRIKVQVKRESKSVTVEGLRSFMAVLGEEDLGIFVNTGGFTKDARDEARSQEKRRITLIDLEHFFDLWVEHYSNLEDQARQRMPLRPIYFLSPTD